MGGTKEPHCGKRISTYRWKQYTLFWGDAETAAPAALDPVVAFLSLYTHRTYHWSPAGSPELPVNQGN
jgi:hypothetical protein